MLKELTRTYGELLKDKRVRSEQTKYEAFSRQRNIVLSKYRRVFQSFNDLVAGLMRAQGFYSEMKDTVSSLHKNVETFVNNRRSEGGQLLSKIEQSKSQGSDQEQQRLKDLMERMSMEPSGSPVSLSGAGRKKSVPAPLSSGTLQQAVHSGYNPTTSPPVTPRYPITANQSHQYMSPGQSHHQAYPSQSSQQSQSQYQQNQPPVRRESYQTQQQQPPQQFGAPQSGHYNPNTYNPVSPPAHQQFFSPPPPQHQQHQPWGQPPQPQQPSYGGTPQPGSQNFLPQGYVPPPPPPGPPPNQSEYGYGGQYVAAQTQQGHAYRGSQGQQQQGQGQDPWAGLSGWK
jgi:programmed cell death 6-interacting protein